MLNHYTFKMNNKVGNDKTRPKRVIQRIWPFNTLSVIFGISPLTLKFEAAKPHSIFQIIYVGIILLLFLFELVYVVIYQEIVMGSTYSIMNLTHLFNLFAENIISCTCVIHSVVFSKMACENFQSCTRVLNIFSQLNLELDFKSTRRNSILYLVITYGLIFQAGFALDYYLLFGDSDKKYISFQSWVFFVIHICYNAFALLFLVFSLQVLKVRFMVLNSAMKDLNCIGEQNLVSEMHVLGRRKSKRAELPVTEKVMMMKEAHDRLYHVCAKGWISQNQFALCEIVTSGILITSYLYLLIGMMIDDQLDSKLMFYCSYWILYRFLIITILVISYDGVCKQVRFFLYKPLRVGTYRRFHLYHSSEYIYITHQNTNIIMPARLRPDLHVMNNTK